jgi:hypothetical protein
MLAGTALQLSTGAADPSILSYPWGMIAAANYLYLLILISFNREKWKWTEWLYNRQTYISSLATMLILTLLFGLIRQDGREGGILGILGFTQMRTSWIFILNIIHLMTILGVRSIEEIRRFNRQRLPVTIIHLSFFAILAAAIFGSGEKTRITVTAVQGEPTNTGTTKEGKIVRLPFTLRLKKFSIEEYPPRIHILTDDNLTKEHISIEAGGDKGHIGTWQIECLEYLESAGIMPGDSTYMTISHVGATTATRLRATNGNHTVEGWASCGSHIFPASILTLDSTHALVMPPREAALYLSDVKIESSKGVREDEIRVNHPASIGPWKIYQVSYDKERGKWSTISILECVKDGWYPIVQVALWIILASGAAMAFSAGLRNKRKEGMS